MAMNLKDEILGGESYSLEFKLVPNEDRIKYLKTVVAFANGKGGRILFGVANNGTVRGIARDKVFQERDAIVNSISDACSPRVPIDAGIENIDGKQVVVIDVPAGSRCPYYLKSEGRGFDCEPCPKAKVQDGLSAKMIDAILARSDEYLTFWP